MSETPTPAQDPSTAESSNPIEPETAAIVTTLTSLTDIEGDLADTALAVAATGPELIEGLADSSLQAGKETEERATVAAEPAEGAGAEAELGSTHPTNGSENVDPSSAILNQAEALEGILENAIPDLPAPSTNSNEAQHPLNSPSQAVPAPASHEAMAIDHSAADDAQQLIAAVEADIDQPILPESVVTPAQPLEPSTSTTNGQHPDAQAGARNGSTETPLPSAVEAPIQLEPSNGGTPAVALPEGLSASSPSVRNNPGLVQAWQSNPTEAVPLVALLDWSIQRTEVVDARAWYEVLAGRNPTAFKPLLSLINLELALSNFEHVEALFSRALRSSSTLMAAADVNIWKAYLHYIRRQNPLSDGPEGQRARDTVTQAYEVALKECGLDRESGDIWQEYITYLADAKPKTPWDQQQQTDALRKLYQRAVCIPLNNVEALWKGYDAFESGLNKQTAKKFLAERSPAYMTARTALRELRTLTDSIPHPAVPPTPNFSDEDRRVVSSWRAYLKWEEGNPLAAADTEVLAARVGYALKRCLTEMRHFPELWHYAASYYQKDGKEEGIAFLRAGLQACPKSFLLAFALAEVEEEKRDYTACHTIFESLLTSLNAEIDDLKLSVEREVEIARGPEIVAPPSGAPGDDVGPGGAGGGDDDMGVARLIRERDERAALVRERRERDVNAEAVAASVVWIMYMRFARRSEGLKGGRLVFGKARKSAHVTWHIFEASAMMEYHSNKDSAVAIRVFEVGLKQFADDVDYVLAYLSFLLSINDDTNARALFERSAVKIPTDQARPLWDAWAEYEYMLGDLAAVKKLESRFATTFPNDSPLKRFALRFTYNGIDEIARRDLGFGRRPAPAQSSAPSAPTPSALSAPGVSLAPPPGPGGGGGGGVPNLPPFPPNLRGGTPQPPLPLAQPHNPSSPLKRERDSVDRDRAPPPPVHSKRHRSTVSPPPVGSGRRAGSHTHQMPNERGGSRDRDVSGHHPPPRLPAVRERSPPRRSQDRGYPPVPPQQGYQGRDDLDRSGLTRSLAWFVGSLPPARSFDGPTFHADDIIQLFDHISPAGTGLAPGPGAGTRGPPPPPSSSYPNRFPEQDAGRFRAGRAGRY